MLGAGFGRTASAVSRRMTATGGMMEALMGRYAGGPFTKVPGHWPMGGLSTSSRLGPGGGLARFLGNADTTNLRSAAEAMAHKSTMYSGPMGRPPGLPSWGRRINVPSWATESGFVSDLPTGGTVGEVWDAAGRYPSGAASSRVRAGTAGPTIESVWEAEEARILGASTPGTGGGSSVGGGGGGNQVASNTPAGGGISNYWKYGGAIAGGAMLWEIFDKDEHSLSSNRPMY